MNVGAPTERCRSENNTCPPEFSLMTCALCSLIPRSPDVDASHAFWSRRQGTTPLCTTELDEHRRVAMVCDEALVSDVRPEHPLELSTKFCGRSHCSRIIKPWRSRGPV